MCSEVTLCKCYIGGAPTRHFFHVLWSVICQCRVISGTTWSKDDVVSVHVEFLSVCSTGVKVLARKLFTAKFQCKDVSGTHATLTSARISSQHFLPSEDTTMFQGTVERVSKEPTLLTPSTMNFPVDAPPECRGSQIVSQHFRDREFFPLHKCDKFSKCPRRITCVLTVVVARNVERLAPLTMKCIWYFLSHLELALRCIISFMPSVLENKSKELMNCLCIKRGILRPWVNRWLRFGKYLDTSFVR